MYEIQTERGLGIIAKFQTPISHHDASIQTKSNESVFHRARILVNREAQALPDQDQINAIVQQYPCPVSMAPYLQNLTAASYLAAAFTKEWIGNYTHGEGLFDGVERYRRLEERMKMGAIRSATMFEFFGGLNADMQVTAPHRYEALLPALTMPAALGLVVLGEFIDNSSGVMLLAQMWHKARSEDQVTLTLEQPAFAGSTSSVVDVPGVSANSIRHEMLREPAALHLLSLLGLTYDDLKPSVAALLYNGGDLKTSEPAGAFKMSRQIAEAYPSLGLLSGSADGFILGASNVEVSAWLVTTEYGTALEPFGIHPQVSAFDLLDRITMTRHAAGRIDASPMPFGFEALIAGTEVFININQRPYISRAEKGALYAALDTFIKTDGTLFGQSARGFGKAAFDFLNWPDDAAQLQAEYEDYIEINRDAMRQGLLDGTLCTGTVVLS